MQIIDVASILGLDYDISDHAFQLLDPHGKRLTTDNYIHFG